MKHGFSLQYKRYMISTFTVPRSIAVPIKMVINFYGFVLNILFTLLYVIPCMGGILKNQHQKCGWKIRSDATLFSLVNFPINYSVWSILGKSNKRARRWHLQIAVYGA